MRYISRKEPDSPKGPGLFPFFPNRYHRFLAYTLFYLQISGVIVPCGSHCIVQYESRMWKWFVRFVGFFSTKKKATFFITLWCHIFLQILVHFRTIPQECTPCYLQAFGSRTGISEWQPLNDLLLELPKICSTRIQQSSNQSVHK